MEGGGPSTECQGPAGRGLHPLKHCGVEKTALIEPFAGLQLGTLLGEGGALPRSFYGIVFLDTHSGICRVGRGGKRGRRRQQCRQLARENRAKGKGAGPTGTRMS